jgi:hypothetical protein
MVRAQGWELRECGARLAGERTLEQTRDLELDQDALAPCSTTRLELWILVGVTSAASVEIELVERDHHPLELAQHRRVRDRDRRRDLTRGHHRDWCFLSFRIVIVRWLFRLVGFIG